MPWRGGCCAPGNNAMKDFLWSIFWLVAIVWLWGYMLASLHWVVAPALKTGVLQARGRTYSRAEQPVRFWLGIVFWIVMAGLTTLFVYLISVIVYRLGTQLWRT